MSILSVPRFSVSTRHPSCGDAYTREMTCAWQETDTVPPDTVQVLTTGVAAGCGAAVVAGADDCDAVRLAVEVTLGEPVVAVVSSEEGVGAVVADVGVAVSGWTLTDVDTAGDAVAA